LRTNFREQTSPLEIRDQNLILSAPVPKNGDGKILKLNSGWSLLRAGPCSEVIVKTGLIVGRKQLNNTQRMSFLNVTFLITFIFVIFMHVYVLSSIAYIHPV
jgi:hypothetical protein